jgi:hypothetical protein
MDAIDPIADHLGSGTVPNFSVKSSPTNNSMFLRRRLMNSQDRVYGRVRPPPKSVGV